MSEQQMTLWLIVVVALILVVVFVLRKAPEASVRLEDLKNIFQRMREAQDGAFAMFAFLPPDGKTPDDAVNIQFSREEGSLGVDWFLLAPRNVREKERFVEFAKSRECRPADKEAQNGAKYVRVTDGDLAGLLEGVLRELYAVQPETSMDLVFQGFTWP